MLGPLVPVGHGTTNVPSVLSESRTNVPPLMVRPGQTRREAGTQSQGSPATETARSPAQERTPDTTLGVDVVKANLARFTWALAIVASMALTLGAGIRWH